MRDQKVLPDQILLLRSYVKLLFTGHEPDAVHIGRVQTAPASSPGSIDVDRKTQLLIGRNWAAIPWEPHRLRSIPRA